MGAPSRFEASILEIWHSSQVKEQGRRFLGQY
jgi:hypothetical protein